MAEPKSWVVRKSYSEEDGVDRDDAYYSKPRLQDLGCWLHDHTPWR